MNVGRGVLFSNGWFAAATTVLLGLGFAEKKTESVLSSVVSSGVLFGATTYVSLGFFDC